MALQIFGTKKSADTRKAERFFRERRVPFQIIDLAEKGISPGELRAVAQAVGRDALIDTASPHFTRKGLAYQDYDPEEQALSDPLLLRTPIVRDGARAVIGTDPKGWESFLDR